MDSQEKISGAISALQKAADDIRRVEAEARSALFERDDAHGHRTKLEEKTMILIDLHETVEPFLDGMSKQAREEIEKGVKDFAGRATQAWEISSIFYMSALLYPDEYKEGDKNDLEQFIAALRNRYLS